MRSRRTTAIPRCRDARYVNALKLFLSGVTPLEYQAYQGFARVGRQFSGAGARMACQMQAIDELRHVQTQIHAMSHYNKHFNGLHDFAHMHDRVWFLSVPKSFFEDARTAGPFEFLTAISFSFEYVLTNLLFVPFMSGAAFNGDMATVTFGFSAQSDEARHMTLGLEVIKFMLEQHEDNVPIIQRWIDKWFWRGYRLLTLVGMMMDYMLPNKVMSWSEAWGVYFEEAGGALFKDLERYGIRPPKHVEEANIGKDHISHQAWSIFYQYSQATNFHTWMPTDEELDWLSAKYPDTFDKIYRPRFEHWRALQEKGERFYNPTLPMLCQICQIPLVVQRAGRPDHAQPSQRRARRRALSLLLPGLLRHLRVRAGQVHPGLAAGAPDPAGQLRWRGRRVGGARLLQHQSRPGQLRVPGLHRASALAGLAPERSQQHAGHPRRPGPAQDRLRPDAAPRSVPARAASNDPTRRRTRPCP